MNYKKTIEDFLNTCSHATAKEYWYKLKVFHTFLAKKRSMDDTNYKHIMSYLKPQDVIDSIEYYIKNCDVQFKLTVDGYFFALAAFFNYLHLNKHFENELFSKNTSRNDLKQLVDATGEKHGLKEKQVFPPLTDDEVDRLIDRCNEILNDPDSDKLTFTDQQKYNKQFSLFMSAIIVKLIIFSGVANDTLISMTTSDVNNILGKVNINGYWVHLPDELFLQLKRYMTIREKNVQDESNTLLFFSAETLMKTNNGQIMKVLRELFTHSRAMSIAKHSIIRKLEVKMPTDMIMRFTGYSGDVIGHCLEIYNDRSGVSAERIIDIGLHNDRYFDNL